MRKRAPGFFLIVLGLSACAIPEPPPGGPEDKTPPSVVATVPGREASGVAPESAIRFEFSEPMRRDRLEGFVQFSPPADIARVRWKKSEATLELETPLHPDTTYVVELKPGYTDSHGVRSTEHYRFAFATSAHIDSGAVSGKVLFRREPTDKGIVRLFVLPRDSAFTPASARPDREARADGEGSFSLEYLAINGRPLVVWAFHDADGNGSFDPSREAGLVPADTVVLGAGSTRVDGLQLAIVDPREPAVVKGRVENLTGVDTVLASVSAHELADTLPPTYYVRCDAEGAFELEVLKGRYVFHAFLDFDADSLCSAYPCPGDSSKTCPEPCVTFPDTLSVEPGDRRELPPIELPPTRQERP